MAQVNSFPRHALRVTPTACQESCWLMTDQSITWHTRVLKKDWFNNLVLVYNSVSSTYIMLQFHKCSQRLLRKNEGFSAAKAVIIPYGVKHYRGVGGVKQTFTTTSTLYHVAMIKHLPRGDCVCPGWPLSKGDLKPQTKPMEMSWWEHAWHSGNWMASIYCLFVKANLL